ncbi:MAG: hypothetical protein LBD73_05040, partial [Deferribacteraceae bacterium]|nr:hypothetical protein [Deferribacteraceae bacterium]
LNIKDHDVGVRPLKETAIERELKMVTEGASGQIKRETVSFCFYRIVNGIKKIFSFCKELYRFREKKKTKTSPFFHFRGLSEQI